MPRDGSYHYAVPAGTDGVTDQTIDSGRYNAFVHDVETDLNVPRPISAGGTGASNAHDAMLALNGEITHQTVTNYDTFPFASGSFYSNAGATGEPVSGHYFAGICYLYDPSGGADVVLEARDLTEASPGKMYVRRKTAGVWGAWSWDNQATSDAAASKVAKTGDTMTGNLTLGYGQPTIILGKTSGATGVNQIVGAIGTIALWAIRPGDDTPTTGSNVGANFVLQRYDDTGAFLDTPLAINRADGRVYGNSSVPLSGNEFVKKAYVDGAGATGLAGKVAKAGDTMTGPLAGTSITLSGAYTSSIGSYNFNSGATASLVYNGTDYTLTGGGNFNITANVIGNVSVQAKGGAYFFQNGTRYLQHDGTAYTLAGGALTVNGNVSSTSSVAGTVLQSTAGSIYCNALAGAGALLFLQDQVGTNQGYVYWDRPTVSVNIQEATSGAKLTIFSTGHARFTAAMDGRAGQAGVFDNSAHNFYWTGSVNQMWIDTTNLGTVSVTCDYRTKKDVAPLASTWDAVKALKPISYTQAEYTSPSDIAAYEAALKTTRDASAPPFSPEPPPLPPTPPGALFVADDIERWGFIAHELQETLLPSAATGEKDSHDTVQSPNLMAVCAALCKALQEAMARIEALEARP